MLSCIRAIHDYKYRLASPTNEVGEPIMMAVCGMLALVLSLFKSRYARDGGAQNQ